MTKRILAPAPASTRPIIAAGCAAALWALVFPGCILVSINGSVGPGQAYDSWVDVFGCP